MGHWTPQTQGVRETNTSDCAVPYTPADPGVDRFPCSRPWTGDAGLFLHNHVPVLAGNHAPEMTVNTLRVQVERSTWTETRSNWGIIFRGEATTWNSLSETLRNAHTWLRSHECYSVNMTSKTVFRLFRCRERLEGGEAILLVRGGGQHLQRLGTVPTRCVRGPIIRWQQLDKVCIVDSFEQTWPGGGGEKRGG